MLLDSLMLNRISKAPFRIGAHEIVLSSAPADVVGDVQIYAAIVDGVSKAGRGETQGARGLDGEEE